jgi:hypothetical protein
LAILEEKALSPHLQRRGALLCRLWPESGGAFGLRSSFAAALPGDELTTMRPISVDPSISQEFPEDVVEDQTRKLKETERWKEACKKAGECGHGWLQHENEMLIDKIEKLKKVLEMLEAGFTGMFGHQEVSFQEDCETRGMAIIKQALAELENKSKKTSLFCSKESPLIAESAEATEMRGVLCGEFLDATMGANGKKFHILTFGCQMNKAESDRLGSLFEQNGYQLIDNAEEADVIVLNSCVVRQSAESKVVNKLNALKQLKKVHPQITLAVTGCIVDSNIDNLKKWSSVIFADIWRRNASGLFIYLR